MRNICCRNVYAFAFAKRDLIRPEKIESLLPISGLCDQLWAEDNKLFPEELT